MAQLSTKRRCSAVGIHRAGIPKTVWQRNDLRWPPSIPRPRSPNDGRWPAHWLHVARALPVWCQ